MAAVTPTDPTGRSSDRFRVRRWSLAVCLAVVAGACGSPAVDVTASPVAAPPSETSSDLAPTTTPTPTATATPSPTPTPAERFPLTGEPTTDARLGAPAMAVKIDNSPSAYPQTALERADIVVEEVVEGGLTRLVPIFHSEIPDVVGPIRSARFVDVDMLPPWTPILVFAGARAEVLSAVRGSDTIGMVSDSGTEPFFRDTSRAAPHNLYARGPQVYEIGRTREEVAPVTSAFTFAPAPDDGTDGTTLDIDMTYYQTTSWEWDDQDQVYRRFTNGEPYRVTGEGRVGAANVLVMLTDISQRQAGKGYMRTTMTGSGDAVLLRDGRRYDVQWHKDSINDHLRFQFADGSPVPMAVGPTWLHLAPYGAVG